MKYFKLLAFAATAAVVAASTAFCGAGAAFADENETGYPENFTDTLTFASLTDYAVKEGEYAFAEGTSIYIVSVGEKENLLTAFECGFGIKYLNYAEDGNLYFSDGQNNAYVYPDANTSVEYSLVPPSNRLTDIGNYIYYIKNDGTLGAMDDNNETTDIDAGFTTNTLKSFNGSAYAIKDNALYKITDTTATRVDCTYINYKKAEDRLIGDFADALKSDEDLKHVTVKESSFVTQINLNDISGSTFKTTKAEGHTFKLEGDKSALLIATRYNASIIIMNENGFSTAYLTLTANCRDSVYTNPAKDATNAYSRTATKLYSTPYMCKATEIKDIPQRAELTVLKKFALKFSDTLTYIYYKVSYADESGVSEGYIANEYLTEFTFAADDKKPNEVKDDFDYSTNVETVILVLVIVGLVILAIAYLTAVGTKGNGKRKTKHNKPLPPDED